MAFWGPGGRFPRSKDVFIKFNSRISEKFGGFAHPFQAFGLCKSAP